MSSWVKRGGRIGRRFGTGTRDRGMVCAPSRETALPPRCPPKQKAATPEWAGVRERPLCCPTCGPLSFKEFLMKRIIVALVLALTVVSGVVGCGGGSSTTKAPTNK